MYRNSTSPLPLLLCDYTRVLSVLLPVRDKIHSNEREVLNEIARAARLNTLDGCTLHVRTPLRIACPALDENKHASVFERLMKFVAQAAGLFDGFGDQFFLRCA